MSTNSQKRVHARPWVGLSPLAAKRRRLDSARASAEEPRHSSNDAPGPASLLVATSRQRDGSDDEDDEDDGHNHCERATILSVPGSAPTPPLPPPLPGLRLQDHLSFVPTVSRPRLTTLPCRMASPRLLPPPLLPLGPNAECSPHKSGGAMHKASLDVECHWLDSSSTHQEKPCLLARKSTKQN